jgi:hypothetical protein
VTPDLSSIVVAVYILAATLAVVLALLIYVLA